jgi:hypothetical protein
VKTPAERQQERRQAKLDEIERDVARGTLVIRKMTAAEREKYPPREREPRAKRRR